MPDQPLDDELRTGLLHALAPVGEVTGLTPLTGGMFATSVRVDLADGRRLVAKTAPAQDDRLLRYEHDLIRTEALVYRLAGDDPALPMPALVHADLTREHLPGDLVVASWAEGVRADTLAETTPALRRGLGGVMAALHRHTGDCFGYPSGTADLRGPDWAGTFTAMIDAVLADGADWAVPLPVPQITAALRRHRGALAAVTRPALVHADLWPGNVFVHPESGELTGVIDPERAFWGDPLFDLIASDPFHAGAPDDDLVAGYRAGGGDEPLDPIRLALCRLYLALIMRVEVRPRRYAGDWLPGYLDQIDAQVSAALAELA